MFRDFFPILLAFFYEVKVWSGTELEPQESFLLTTLHSTVELWFSVTTPLIVPVRILLTLPYRMLSPDRVSSFFCHT